jgi:hypothetical protein
MASRSISTNRPEQVAQNTLTGRLSANRTLLALLGLALAGAALVLVITRWGAYLSDDTYYYIYPARDLLAGKGFNPSYIFAPLYPLALAGVSLLGLETLDAARWLNALLLGVNIFLVGRIILRMSVPPVFSLLAAGLILLSDAILEAHGWAMSEALSLSFMLLTMDLILHYIDTGDRRFWWAAAFTAAACVLTRYAALPLIGAAALGLLFFAPYPRFVGRLKNAVLFGVVSTAPIVLYWLRNQMTSGHPVRYERYFFEPLTRSQLDWFLYHWTSLFVPGRLLRERELLAGVVIGIAVFIVVAALWWIYRSQLRALADQRFAAGLFLLGAVIGLNFLMLYLSRGLTELDVFNPRYLVPPLLAFLMIMAAAAGRLWQVGGRWLRLALVAFLAVFLVYYGYRTVDFTRIMLREGLGYSNAGWHNSETVAYLRAHPELTDLVSTGEMGIYFWTGRKPTVLAAFATPQAVLDYLCQNEAVLLMMDQMPAEMYGLNHDEVVQGLTLVEDFNDSDMLKCSNGR